MPKRVRTLSVVLPLLLLLGIGLVMVYDASVMEGQKLFGDRYHFVRLHLISIAIGLLAAAVLSRLPTQWLTKLSAVFLAAALFLLAAVLLGKGVSVKGAQRWLDLGFLSFQPSELTKLAVVLYLSAWLKKRPNPAHFFILAGVIFALLILQPDLGTAIIILASAFLMLFVSGVPLKIFAVSGAAVFLLLGVFIAIAPYRWQRLGTFFDPAADPLGGGYHINQVLLSLGSGGWGGLGLGRSRQKFQYLPEAATDSIFAVVGEELGFAGGAFLILIFLYFYFQLFKIALREGGAERKLLATGLAGWLFIQTMVNLGGMTALLPLTGVPLPFVSYGRSSLLTQLASVGILLRISLTQK